MPECSVKTSVGTLDRSKVLLPAQKLQPEADPDLAMSSAAAASTTRAGGLEAGAAGAIWVGECLLGGEQRPAAGGVGGGGGLAARRAGAGGRGTLR